MQKIRKKHGSIGDIPDAIEGELKIHILKLKNRMFGIRYK
jgi:hypothetical protein